MRRAPMTSLPVIVFVLIMFSVNPLSAATRRREPLQIALSEVKAVVVQPGSPVLPGDRR